MKAGTIILGLALATGTGAPCPAQSLFRAPGALPGPAAPAEAAPGLPPRLKPQPTAVRLKLVEKLVGMATPADLGASVVVDPVLPVSGAGGLQVLLGGTRIDWEIGASGGLAAFQPKGAGRDSEIRIEIQGLAGKRALVDCAFALLAKDGTVQFTTLSPASVAKATVDLGRAAIVLPKPKDPTQNSTVVVLQPGFGADGKPQVALRGCEITALK